MLSMEGRTRTKGTKYFTKGAENRRVGERGRQNENFGRREEPLNSRVKNHEELF